MEVTAFSTNMSKFDWGCGLKVVGYDKPSLVMGGKVKGVRVGGEGDEKLR